MNRRRFSILTGIILATLAVRSADGQAPSRPSIGQRMSSLRNGWSPSPEDQPLTDADMVGQSTQQQQQPAKRSMFSGWFGRDEQPQQSANQSESSARVGSAQCTGTSAAARVAARPQNGNTARTSPSRSAAALPGLGGSPLPRGAAANSSPTGGRYAAQPQSNSSVGTAQQPARRGATANASSNRSATQRTAQAARPSTTLKSATTSTSPATASRTRQSPGRRTAPHISPDELRRELAGSFPEPVATEGAARVARGNSAADSSQTDSATSEAATLPLDGVTSRPVPPAAAGPLTIPTIEEDRTTADSNNSTANNPTEADTDITAQSIADNPQPALTVGNPTDEGTSAARNSGSPSFGASNFVRSPRSNSRTTGMQTARGKEAFGEALQVASGGDPNVLVSNQTPILSIDIRGPKQILVGREAVFRVKLQNQSDVPADGIVANIKIPAWAEVLNTTPTQGMVNQQQETHSAGPLQWQLAHLDRRASETLEIHLVPKESKPLELAVSWTTAPVGSRTIVEVQEPKLKLDVTGPTEVLFDKPQVFQLTISNPGTGPAENVKIDLIPPGGDQQKVTSHQLGALAAGESQTVEVELTARDAGKMFVKAAATAEGGLTCDASKEIFCRKPELELDWRGPATKYSGTMATYFFRVRNPGTAPADDVAVKVTLPEGTEFTSGSEGQAFDAERREVSWNVGTLQPGDDNYMELKCMVKNAGPNKLSVTAATASGNLSISKTAETNVVAIADLKLEVSDPSGPIAVGSQAVYEIHVQNRGANTAKDVNIIALFSDGIEPEQAEGAMYTVADGRVTFKTIEDLPAGRDVVLRIRAHAVQPGTHVFRAEVLCRDLEIKLAAEETTRFYADDVMTDSDQQPSQEAASRSDAFAPAVR